MNRLEMALRHYKSIVPAPIINRHKYPTAKLEVWLREDVSKVAEMLSDIPKFREYATWSIRSLCKGAKTKERRLLDKILGNMMDTASSIQEPLNRTSVASNNRELGGITETLLVTSQGETVLHRGKMQPADVAKLPFANPSNWLVNNNIPDPVNLDDYYEPNKFFFDKRATSGNLIPGFNAKLRTIGDFVVRTMFERLDTLVYMQTEAVSAASTVDHPANERGFGISNTRRMIEELKELCMAGTRWEMCDSCVTLVQVHSAFHHSKIFEWLNLSTAAKSGAAIIHHRLVSQSNVEMTERIAAALESLKDLFTTRIASKDSAIRLIRKGGLVIFTKKKEAYWQGKKTKLNGERQPAAWKLFLALAKKSMKTEVVTLNDISKDDGTFSSINSLYTTFHRVKSMMPPSLKKHLLTVSKIGYRLDLAAGIVSIL